MQQVAIRWGLRCWYDVCQLSAASRLSTHIHVTELHQAVDVTRSCDKSGRPKLCPFGSTNSAVSRAQVRAQHDWRAPQSPALEDAGVIRKRSEHCKPRRNRVPGRVNVFETT